MKMRTDKRVALLALPLALAACVSMPSGPSVMVLPGTGMSFEQFRQDDALCRQYAAEQVGQTPEGASDSSGLRSAAVGTAVGAVAGALIDGRRGAGVGAGTGLVVGSAAGAGSAQVSGREAQRRYDNAFVQCMYARGHRVPVSGHYAPERPSAPAAPSMPAYPPPNQPPPAPR
ncbi:MAG: hypothetical protein AMXMBFR31_09640 [Candidatus Desulfobacillus denitrificans]|nr:MAG: hypothetical protein B6D47_05105 [Rhodocyclaceae bacterium UTPRO2]